MIRYLWWPMLLVCFVAGVWVAWEGDLPAVCGWLGTVFLGPWLAKRMEAP